MDYPADWEVYKFDEIFQILSNNTLSRDKLTVRGNIGNIHYGDVLIKYGLILTKNDDIPKIKSEYESYAKTFLQKNDIIIADTAEDETVGKAVQIGDINFSLVSGLHTIPCRPVIHTIPGYLGYYINCKAYHDQLLPYITGIKVSSISKSSIKNTLIHLPPLDEQKAIANTLETFDAHIKNLSELIEKKRAIRDGTLNDLMTGRTRLKGFSGEWEVKKLGDICKISAGFMGDYRLQKGKYRLTRIETIADGIINENKIGYSNIEPDYTFKLTVEDILYSNINSLSHIGKVAQYKKDLDLYHGSNLLRLTPYENVSSNFLFHVLSSEKNRKWARIHANPAVNQASINQNLLKSQEIILPPLPEQQAIAETLTAFDDEIKALEAERDKIIKIRDGAMNDLLTGKIRLKF